MIELQPDLVAVIRFHRSAYVAHYCDIVPVHMCVCISFCPLISANELLGIGIEVTGLDGHSGFN